MNALVVSNGGQRWGTGLDRAAQLLAGQSGTVTLVHIIPRTSRYGRGLPVWDEWDDLQAERATSAALLHEGARHLAVCCPNLRIRTRSVVGEPSELILRMAAETGAEVLILDGRLQASCPFDTPRASMNVPDRPALSPVATGAA